MRTTAKHAWSKVHLLLVLAPFLAAQDPTGVIQGQITDPSGASVPNAEISARNTHTGFVAAQHSARDGAFHLSYLPVGEYDLHVSAQGVASYDFFGIRVDVNCFISLPFSLQIGSSSTQLNVAANTANNYVSFSV